MKLSRDRVPAVMPRLPPSMLDLRSVHVFRAHTTCHAGTLSSSLAQRWLRMIFASTSRFGHPTLMCESLSASASLRGSNPAYWGIQSGFPVATMKQCSCFIRMRPS